MTLKAAGPPCRREIPELPCYRPPSPADLSLQGRANQTRVIVLGAGVAGLCTAYERVLATD